MDDARRSPSSPPPGEPNFDKWFGSPQSQKLGADKPDETATPDLKTPGNPDRGVEDYLLPRYVRMAIDPDYKVSDEAIAAYVQRKLKECGNPADPLERNLAEIAVVTHVAVLRNHALISLAGSADRIAAYAGVATRLSGEYRRTVLAIRKCRSQQTQAPVTKIEQQNIAANQHVTFVNGEGSEPMKSMACRDENLPDIKVGSKPEVPDANSRLNQEPSPRSRRPVEPAATGSIVAGRSAPITGGRLSEPALAFQHRPENGPRQSNGRRQRPKAPEGRAARAR